MAGEVAFLFVLVVVIGSFFIFDLLFMFVFSSSPPLNFNSLFMFPVLPISGSTFSFPISICVILSKGSNSGAFAPFSN